MRGETFVSPGLDELREIAERYELNLSESDLREYRALMEPALASCRRVEELPPWRPPVEYKRSAGSPPEPSENPLNAWSWRVTVRGADDGPLAGRTVAVKDNINVARVPMTVGTALLEGFKPDFDATVVTRVLDAGGEIAGKSTCEQLCLSDASHTADGGPVLNPHDPTRTTGGSSSGSAALVAAGQCDLALGGDQGGSILMPSSFCGIYGLKPSHGLVPCTGVCPLERTLDHVGPMGAAVTDLALLLQAIAGPDQLDSRQSGRPPGDYLVTLDDGIEGLRVGVLKEAFGRVDPDVDRAVRSAIDRTVELGAVADEVSIPMHSDAAAIWDGIVMSGTMAQLIHGATIGTNAKGLSDVRLATAFRRALGERAEALAPTVKLTILLGEHLAAVDGGLIYGRAQNAALELDRAYGNALRSHDVLVMPTTRTTALPLPPANASITEYVDTAWEIHEQTCPFDVTGHPAINIPCAVSDGLPVGLMAVADHGCEATLLRLARAWEEGCGPGSVPSMGEGGRT